MSIYEEKTPVTWKSAILLIFAFFSIYFPLQGGSWELRWKEDKYAAMALEMNIEHPNTVAHGEQVPFSYPMFPWLAALLHRTGFSIELTLRLISVASVAALMILVWVAGRRANDLQTAVVAAAMMCSTVVVVEKCLDGYPDATGLLFLLSAWLAWFTFGVARGRWNSAWIISFFFCGLTFYTIGWYGVLLFIVPLIFMRRPMTVWPKLAKPGFFIGVFLLLLLALIWIFPRWWAAGHLPFRELDFDIAKPKVYLKHLLTFPFDIILRFLPWSLLAWPAFCVAYYPLDKNPIFSRFLRTIVISIFFLLWFSPFTDARDFIYIVPPLSLLCGINYWLLVRRYGHELHFLLKFLMYAGMLFAVGIILFYLLPDSIMLKFPYADRIQYRESNQNMGLVLAAAALLTSLISIRFSEKSLPVYAHTLLVSVVFALGFWAVHVPYRAQRVEKKTIGAAFSKAIRDDLQLDPSEKLPSDFVVYKGPGIVGFYAPCIYMGIPVRKVHKLSELPDDKKTVYMISTKFPASAKREWSSVPPKASPHLYRHDKFYIFKGTLIKKDKNGKKKQ